LLDVTGHLLVLQFQCVDNLHLGIDFCILFFQSLALNHFLQLLFVEVVELVEVLGDVAELLLLA
jgi:hypothetical protein